MENEEIDSQEQIREIFERNYQKWESFCSSAPVLSEPKLWFATSHYDTIVGLGPAALPFLIEKIKLDAKFHLIHVACVKIARISRIEYYPWAPELTLEWWEGGQELVNQRFDSLFTELRRFTSQDNSKKVAQFQRIIQSMGIATLSRLMERLREKDYDMLPLIENITQHAIGAKSQTPEEQAREWLIWWENNRRKWLIPFNDQKMVGESDEIKEVLPFLDVEVEHSVFGDSILFSYYEVKRLMENSSLTAREKKDFVSRVYHSLLDLATISHPRAEGLALECFRDDNLMLKDAAIYVFATLKSQKGAKLLLYLLKSGPLRDGSLGGHTLLSGWPIYRARVMWALTQIGDSVVPYLREAIKDTDEVFKQRVAIIVGRIGTEDSILKLQAGTVLTKMIDSRQDSFYLEDAIRGVQKLRYEKAIPSLFALLQDTTIMDRPLISMSDFGFTPNLCAINVLNNFGLPAKINYAPRTGRVYEFTDLSGTLHRINK